MTAPVVTAPEVDQLTRYAAAALGFDASLDTVLVWMRELQSVAENSPVDSIGMARTLGTIAGSLKSVSEAVAQHASPDLRAAPFPELGELLRESSNRCLAPTCDEWLPPWGDSVCDNDGQCLIEAQRAFGDVG